MSEEIWKDIEGYEGLYQVSSFGRIKRLKRVIEIKSKVYKTLSEKILKPTKHDTGYFVIGLSDLLNNRKRYKVHRLVAKAFVKNPYNKPEVDHIDTNKLNNRADNLRWVTRKEQYKNPITYAKVSHKFLHSDYEDSYMFNSFMNTVEL